jgi:hypothetical protein
VYPFRVGASAGGRPSNELFNAIVLELAGGGYSDAQIAELIDDGSERTANDLARLANRVHQVIKRALKDDGESADPGGDSGTATSPSANA